MPEEFKAQNADNNLNQGADAFRQARDKQNSSGDSKSHYKENQNTINAQFGKNQETDYFDDEEKSNSANNQTNGSANSTDQNNSRDRVKENYEKNQEEINKEFENDSEDEEEKRNETDTEREYRQTKSAYDRVKDVDSDRARKMAERLKEKMRYYEEKMKKEKEEQEKQQNSEKKDSNGAEKNEKKDERTKNKTEEKKQEQTLEELKQESDKAFQDFSESQAELKEKQKKRGAFKKTLSILGFNKDENTRIKQEIKDQEELVENLRTEYRNKFNNLSEKLVQEKQQELAGEGKDRSTISDLIGKWALNGEAISVINDKGQEEKISMREYYNRNEKELLKNRQSLLSEKQKKVLGSVLSKYNNLSKKEKIIYGTGVSALIGSTIVLAGGGALSAALGYGAWKGGKSLFRRVTMGALSGLAMKEMNTKLTERAENKNKEDLEKTEKQIGQTFGEDGFNLFNVIEKQGEIERKRARNRKIAVGVTATALFGTVIGLEGFMAGDASADELNDINLKEVPISDDPDSAGVVDKEGNSGAVLDKKDPDSGGVNNENIADKVNEDKYHKAGSRPDAEGHRAMYANLDEDNIERYLDRDSLGEKVESGGINQENLDNFREQQEAVADIKNYELLNHPFELAEGGNVWNSLSEHFSGDRQEVAKVLASFREETMKDLMENHGMSEVRANQFIEWRYQHMDIGEDFELKNGKLDIPDFDSDKKIAQFEKTEFNNPDSMNDTMENAGESRADRLNEMVDKNKTVEVPEPVETVEVLDPEISAQIDQNVSNLVKDIYGRQAYEWDVMKDKNVLDVINEEYGNPIKQMPDGSGREITEFIESERGDIADNGLDQTEINNRKELRNVLLNLTEKSGIQPNPDEAVEQFIRRVEVDLYTQGVEDNISSKATVEVPDPDSFDKPDETVLKNDLASAPDKLSGWNSLKNAESWEVLNTGDELTRNHIKDLIINSNSVPVEGESLEEFHNRALEKIDGSKRIPQTDLEESLNKVFGKWDGEKIDQWMKMREYKADVIYDRDIYNFNLTDKEHMAFSGMKAHLQELVRASGIEPNSGESLAQYIEKAQKSLRV